MPLKQWQQLTRGWWWMDWSRGNNWLAGFHVDLNIVIWPVWRFDVCRWDGCKPMHGYVSGWRFGRQRAMRAAEIALRWIEQAGATPTQENREGD